MADKDGGAEEKDYSVHIPYERQGFHVKGMDHADWGMQNRMARIFAPATGKAVMLAFDHGYIMGSTAGLERLDLAIPPLLEHADVLMATRGALRSAVRPGHDKAIALRCTAGSSVLDEDMSHEVIGVDIEDAIRLNASCVAVQVFIGAPGQRSSIENLVRTADAGFRYGIPTLGVVAVGKQMERTSRYFLLATRMLAELGASIIKTYYCEDFEKVTAACPVPVVIAGGKKLPEAEALEMAHRALSEGAAGVDMGRNVFQAQAPVAMIRALRAVVHQGYSGKHAFELYEELRRSTP